MKKKEKKIIKKEPKVKKLNLRPKAILNNDNIVITNLDSKENVLKTEKELKPDNTILSDLKNNDIKITNNTNNKNNDDNKANNNNIINKERKNIVINASGTKSFYQNMNLNSTKKLKLRNENEKPEKEEKSELKTIKSKISKQKNKEIISEKKKKKENKEILESSMSMIGNKEEKNEKIVLDDYELNHLIYLEALKLDKRSYCKIYYSLLKRDQNIIYTCVSCNDYNLFYVKIIKFIFIIANIMAMNAFLFSDKSFHKLFMSGVHYYFSYQALQIFLSILITYVVEVILCYLTFTDKYFYEIKALPKNERNGDTIFKIIKCIRIKLIIFFVVALVLTAFYWYSVSAFCAVYPNTVKIYILDCFLSFLFFSIFPFIVYAITTLLRVIAIKDVKKKKLNCLYKVSQLIPIF